MKYGWMQVRVCAWTAIVVLFVLGLALPARAQGPITVVQDEHEHVFRESMTFRLSARSDAKITSIRLFYRVSGQTSANRVELSFDPATSVQVEHVEDMADEENYRPPMITFTYWWVVEDESNNRLKTDVTSFVYEDTSYSWEVLEGEYVRLYWHDQNQGFGQEYFDLAVRAASDLSEEFAVAPKEPVSIVIYNSHEELMSVLVESSAEWTGAVNFSGQNVIVIGLGSSSWMDTVIPHELTHAVLDQFVKPPFGEIPRWLHEGLALRSEGGMGFEERIELDEAIDSNTLISLRVLNSVFADQRDKAILSYAESFSLVDFIIAEHGTESLGELIAVFAEGAHYDDAVMQVFGVDMDGMEDQWREHIGAPPRTGVTRATPAPAVTSTPTSAPPRDAEGTATATPEPAATATAGAALLVPTATASPTMPSPPAPTTTPPPPPRSIVPCLGAVPALGLLALYLVLRPRPA